MDLKYLILRVRGRESIHRQVIDAVRNPRNLSLRLTI